MGRTWFKVRPLPTLIQGFAGDRRLEGKEGITVSLPGLGQSTKTNVDGSFDFGFGEPVERAIPPGRHKIVFNPDGGSASHWTVKRWIFVEEGRLNHAGLTMVPSVSGAESNVASGVSGVMLAEGLVELDLADAELLFPDGSDRGRVNVEFLSTKMIPHDFVNWIDLEQVFAVHPQGIEVKGDVKISFYMPKLDGSHDYLEDYPSAALLVGMDMERLVIAPSCPSGEPA